MLNTDDGPGAYDSDNSTDPDIEAERVNLIDRFRAAARKPTKVTSASKTKKARSGQATTPFKGGYTPDEVCNLSSGKAKKILIQLIAGDNALPRKSRAPTKKAIIEISSDKYTRRLRKHYKRSPDATPTTANPALSPETSSGPPTVTAATADPQTATPANTTTTGPA
ncbi:hypothetical protein Tdes44962_MAKER10020 [Teratosphaeria destructans]|uniref:Uncharacterized protein n=1 Tax=Teratosphaeria destructans TaxID=418781 RepID=A0A9W7W1A9_9PEZI|nr:hypothetical protein Tdes44962_MAKER10020 [Teratosphaeria destructans]